MLQSKNRLLLAVGLIICVFTEAISVDPCDDFYEFACRKYADEHPIPSDLSAYTVYTEVSDDVNLELLNDMAQLKNDSGAAEALKKLNFIFQQCLDNETLEMQSGKPLLNLLFDPTNMIGSWPAINPNWIAENSPPFEQVLGASKKLYGVDSFIYTLVYADDNNSSVNVLNLQNALLGLGLSSYSYYLSSDPLFVGVREAYKAFMNATAVLLAQEISGPPVTVSYKDFEDILQLEVILANLSRKYDFSDGDMLTVAELKTRVPDFNWDLFLVNLLPEGTYNWVTERPSITYAVLSTNYLNAIANVFNSTDKRTVQNYIIWRLVKYFIPYLSEAYRQVEADFNGVFKGSASVSSRQSYCSSLIRGGFELDDLGMASGRVFVDGHFSPQDKEDLTNLTQSILDSFKLLISGAGWMDDSTRTLALAKVNKIYLNIGYPDWILNNSLLNGHYEQLEIPSVPYSPAGNFSFLRSNQMLRSWSARRNFDSLQKPFDKRSFGGSPAATNAWYANEKNSLSLPAGESQSPFYSRTHSAALNYGAIGAVIGHEIQHGFDQQGAFYDANGNVNDWWSAETEEKFANRTQCFKDQFNKYCYPASDFNATTKEGPTQYCISGSRTASENMADLVGLRASFTAFKHRSFRSSRDFVVNSSLTDDQQFFVSFASFFCGNTRPAALLKQLTTNPHTPDRYRVIGTVRNLPEFARAFNCPLGSNMTLPPELTCSIFDEILDLNTTTTTTTTTPISTISTPISTTISPISTTTTSTTTRLTTTSTTPTTTTSTSPTTGVTITSANPTSSATATLTSSTTINSTSETTTTSPISSTNCTSMTTSYSIESTTTSSDCRPTAQAALVIVLVLRLFLPH